MKTTKSHYYFIPILIVSFLVCYHETFLWWYTRCISLDSYYSHGFLIPFVTGYLIWLERKNWMKIESEFSILGLLVVIIALIIHVLGTILYIFSISGFSVFFLVIGATLFLFGKNKTKQILFPLLFLIFMFPLPMAVLSAVSFPLKIIVAKVGTEIVRMMGIPIFREGFDITIPVGTLVVGNPCSGLRSLISFLALGALFSYILNTSLLKRIILFLLSVPIAIFSNFVRVPILILISYFKGLEAVAPDTFVHTGIGLLIFMIGMLLLYTAGKILESKKS